MLPPLIDVLPSFVPASNLFDNWLVRNGARPIVIDDQVSTQAARLLNAISRKTAHADNFYEIYFKTFHKSFPVVNQDVLSCQLSKSPSDSHLSTLMLCMAGLLIASYEHCQGFLQDAWLSVGACARMGQTLGIHSILRTPVPNDAASQTVFEMRRCLWWGVVTLERYVAVW